MEFEEKDFKIKHEFKRHHKGSSIRKLRFHNDYLLTAAKVVKVTDMKEQKVVRKLEADGVKKIYSMLVVDDYLVCAGDDSGRFLLWDYRVERPIHMNEHKCEDYISDLDIDNRAKIVVASSGEGTLTAFDVRSRKMKEPQSELFDSGFTCVRYLEEKDKVITATEDGVMNIFNINGWGNISDRFPVKQNNTGECSIDNMELLDDEEGVFVIGCSDGKLETVSLFPHKVRNCITHEPSGIETLDVNQITKRIVATYDNKVKIFGYEIVQEASKIKKLRKSQSFFADLES